MTKSEAFILMAIIKQFPQTAFGYAKIRGAFKKYMEFSRDKSASKKKRILAC